MSSKQDSRITLACLLLVALGATLCASASSQYNLDSLTGARFSRYIMEHGKLEPARLGCVRFGVGLLHVLGQGHLSQNTPNIDQIVAELLAELTQPNRLNSIKMTGALAKKVGDYCLTCHEILTGKAPSLVESPLAEEAKPVVVEKLPELEPIVLPGFVDGDDDELRAHVKPRAPPSPRNEDVPYSVENAAFGLQEPVGLASILNTHSSSSSNKVSKFSTSHEKLPNGSVKSLVKSFESNCASANCHSQSMMEPLGGIPMVGMVRRFPHY